MRLDQNNEWLWSSRWTHWWLKTDVDNAMKMPAACMDPSFSGMPDDEEMAESVRRFKSANINVILTEGLRRLILFEHEGRTDLIIGGLRKAANLCRKAGIKLLHHTTASFAYQSIEACPSPNIEWLSIDAATGTYAFNKWLDGWYFWCVNNPGFRAEYFRLCKRLLDETGIDGLMVDEVYFRSGWHDCVCPHCLRKYKRMTGFTPPPAEDSGFWGNFENSAFRAWLRFRMVSVGDFYQDLNSALGDSAPHPVLLGCKNAEPWPAHNQCYGDSNEERMRGLNMLFTETEIQTSPRNWRRLSFGFMVYNGLSNYYGTPALAIMYNRNSHEAFWGWALRAAHGVLVWAASFSVIDSALSPKFQPLNSPDTMSLYGKLFAWEAANSERLRGPLKPFANVAVLMSASTRDMVCHGPEWDYYVKELEGWCAALTEEFIQYEIILESDLSERRLKEYSLVILPNAVCLSHESCAAIAGYVSSGGTLILTHETGLRDETGEKQEKAKQLGTLLGCEAPASGLSFSYSGSLGKGKWIYCPGRPGADFVTDDSRRGDQQCVSAAPAQGTVISGMVRRLADDKFPLTVKSAPAGLLIKAFQRDNGSLIVNILDCRGAGAVTSSDSIEENNPPGFSPLENDIVVELRDAPGGRSRLLSPFAGSEDKTELILSHGNPRTIKIPAGAFKGYGVLCIDP